MLPDLASREAIDAAEAFADDLLSYAQLRACASRARNVSAQRVREAHAVWALGPSAPQARAAWVGVWAACAAENCCDDDNTMADPGSLESGLQGNIGARTAQVAAWARSVHDEIQGNDAEEPRTETELFFSFLRGLKNTVQRIEQAVRDGEDSCEAVQQSFILRDLVGNPFRPAQCDPAWRTESVVNMARNAYEHPMPDTLAIIADGLEHDAGCTNQHILRHLRGTEHAMRMLRLMGCTDEKIIAMVSASVGPHDLLRRLSKAVADAATEEDANRLQKMIPVLAGACHVRGCWALDAILQNN